MAAPAGDRISGRIPPSGIGRRVCPTSKETMSAHGKTSFAAPPGPAETGIPLLHPASERLASPFYPASSFAARDDLLMADYIAIATWPFGRTAVQAAAALLEQGRPALDAAVAGGQAVEDDPNVSSVGYGGVANRIGTVSLDASVMDGRTLSCGGVAGVENIKHVAALARRVMEQTPHLLLVGPGAQ